MQTLRNILKIGPAGAVLSDEYGSDSGVSLELMMGTEITLEFDLRENRPSASSALPDYPLEKLVSASYYCAIDAGCVGADQPMLLQISGITLSADASGHTVLSVPIASTAVAGLNAALSGRSSCELYCEIGGLNTGGTAVFAWQFPVTVRNRLFSGSGTATVAEDPAYYTAAQVEAAIARELRFEYSADGTSWHALRAGSDTVMRVRHGENGVPSAAVPLITGPQGEKGDKGDTGEPLMTYLVGGTESDVTMALTGGTHWTFDQPLTGLTFSSVENSHYESEVVFTGGTTLSVAYPASVSVIGDPTFEGGKSYVINVRDGILVAAEYTPGATE